MRRAEGKEKGLQLVSWLLREFRTPHGNFRSLSLASLVYCPRASLIVLHHFVGLQLLYCICSCGGLAALAAGIAWLR